MPEIRGSSARMATKEEPHGKAVKSRTQEGQGRRQDRSREAQDQDPLATAENAGGHALEEDEGTQEDVVTIQPRGAGAYTIGQRERGWLTPVRASRLSPISCT